MKNLKNVEILKRLEIWSNWFKRFRIWFFQLFGNSDLIDLDSFENFEKLPNWFLRTWFIENVDFWPKWFLGSWMFWDFWSFEKFEKWSLIDFSNSFFGGGFVKFDISSRIDYFVWVWSICKFCKFFKLLKSRAYLVFEGLKILKCWQCWPNWFSRSCKFRKCWKFWKGWET